MVDEKIMYRRRRKAGLKIYENSGLRDNLNDDQASPLLKWAVAHVEKGVARTQHMEDTDAQALIDSYVETVSHVLRLVNGLTPTLHEYEQELEAEAVLQRFRESLGLLGAENEALTEVLDEIMANKQSYTPEDSYQALFRLVALAPAEST